MLRTRIDGAVAVGDRCLVFAEDAAPTEGVTSRMVVTYPLLVQDGTLKGIPELASIDLSGVSLSEIRRATRVK